MLFGGRVFMVAIRSAARTGGRFAFGGVRAREQGACRKTLRVRRCQGDKEDDYGFAQDHCPSLYDPNTNYSNCLKERNTRRQESSSSLLNRVHRQSLGRAFLGGRLLLVRCPQFRSIPPKHLWTIGPQGAFTLPLATGLV